MNKETMRKHYEVTPKETLINILISSREQVDKLQKRNKECKQEIERLNNIINKAKIYCEDVIQEHENGEYDVDTTWLAIKEHKENINSVLNILNGDLENYWRSDKE